MHVLPQVEVPPGLSKEERERFLAKTRRDRWNEKKGKEFLKNYHVQYREAHRERFRERARQFKKKNRPWMTPYQRKYKSNYDRSRYPKVRKQKIEGARRWLDNNPDKAFYLRHRRRAIQNNTFSNPKYVAEFRRSIKSKPRFTCYYCQHKFPSRSAHFDHIVPITKGGAHAIENMCASCPSCNCSKRDKLLSAWERNGQQVFPI